MNIKMILAIISTTYLVMNGANAQTYSYNADYAVNYAVKYYNDTSTSPFYYFAYNQERGGNCTNFISQSIVAGLSNKSTKQDVWDARKNFLADRSKSYGTSTQYGYSWYLNDNGLDRGKAWTDADELYKYAKNNKIGYKGLHFEMVTFDTPTKFMDYKRIKIGDIIFADWEGDGTIDHSMIVTKISGFRLGYNEIMVTYQSNEKLNEKLGVINESYNKKVLFYVYRPINYTNDGL